MYNEISIDLGSSEIVIAAAEKGIIARQPSVMLVDRKTREVVNFGIEALQKHREFPSEYSLEKPLVGGISAHLDKLHKLIPLFISDVFGNDVLPQRVVFSIPCNIGEAAEASIIEAAAQCKINEAYVIYSPLAALLANEMDICGSYMALDIGASTTSIMIICRGNIVYTDSINVAGDAFDEAISLYVYEKYGAKISKFTAESIKTKIGTVWEDNSAKKNVDVKTRRPDGSFSTIRLSSDEMFVALEEPSTKLINAICTAISNIPTQFVNDVFTKGILLCGGGSLLEGLSKIISGITGVDTYVFPSAQDAVSLGACAVLRLLPGKMSPSIKNVSKFCLKSLTNYSME